MILKMMEHQSTTNIKMIVAAAFWLLAVLPRAVGLGCGLWAGYRRRDKSKRLVGRGWRKRQIFEMVSF